MAMAAASRIGARALQRARPAGVQGRLFYTRARKLTADETKDAADRLSHIQSKKEQLYDLIAECEKKYPKSAPNNIKLLQHISKQIEPRHDDPLWFVFIISARVGDGRLLTFCTEIAGLLFLGTLTGSAMACSYEKMYPREGNNDKKMGLDEGLKSVLPS